MKKILICDDEFDTQFFIELALEKYKFHLLRAWNGKQAIEITKTEKPDLVIMDYKLPDLNGLTISKEIREIDKDIPIILLTGVNIEPEDRIRLETIVDVFLTKPFDYVELITAIKRILEV